MRASLLQYNRLPFKLQGTSTFPKLTSSSSALSFSTLVAPSPSRYASTKATTAISTNKPPILYTTLDPYLCMTHPPTPVPTVYAIVLSPAATACPVAASSFGVRSATNATVAVSMAAKVTPCSGSNSRTTHPLGAIVYPKPRTTYARQPMTASAGAPTWCSSLGAIANRGISNTTVTTTLSPHTKLVACRSYLKKRKRRFSTRLMPNDSQKNMLKYKTVGRPPAVRMRLMAGSAAMDMGVSLSSFCNPSSVAWSFSLCNSSSVAGSSCSLCNPSCTRVSSISGASSMWRSWGTSSFLILHLSNTSSATT
ncbi:unnamed protein product [Chondrus crispus]|uniref:Uncharacterized protein n=1 Tax=Chondrus crispus TaxID=2769 RepID=R7QJ75_CHOCR|nr:unnamed protein product [Chondrus crispus]CDF38562.1 unnamed protein product [Chondrus crispus]|eukprot:XP_005718467.1 unnamed protein product [Chondrus crispus]